MNAKHTPGPWEYRPFEYDDWGVVRSADGLPVVQACVGRWSKDFDKHRVNKTDPGEANARLISAAPEMLAALEEICAMGYEDKPETWERVRNAIAKAKGDA